MIPDGSNARWIREKSGDRKLDGFSCVVSADLFGRLYSYIPAGKSIFQISSGPIGIVRRDLNLALMALSLDLFFSALWLIILGFLKDLTKSAEPKYANTTRGRGRKVIILVSLQSGIVSHPQPKNSPFPG